MNVNIINITNDYNKTKMKLWKNKTNKKKKNYINNIIHIIY